MLVQRGPSVATAPQLGGNLRIKKNTNILSEKRDINEKGKIKYKTTSTIALKNAVGCRNK